MGRESRIVVVLVIVTLAVIADFVMLTGGGAVRAVLGTLLVLVLPGTALVMAARPWRALPPADRIVLGLGLSVVVSILGGLILHWSPWGLHSGSWTGLLGLVTLGACGAAWARRRTPRDSVGGPGTIQWPRRRHLALLALAGTIVIAAVMIARTSAEVERPGFTQLWLVSRTRGNPGAEGVGLGVRSMELEATAYRLELRVDDVAVAEWPALELMPGQEWTTTVGPALTGSDGRLVEARLYRADDPDAVVRRVWVRSGAVLGGGP